MRKDRFDGEWVYRSFHNNPNIDVDFGELQFGKGILVLQTDDGIVQGSLGGPGWNLNLSGSFGQERHSNIRFQGTGVVSDEPWSYDYEGYLIAQWPHAIDQRPAIVGSVIRTIEHSSGQSPAGYVASFVAIKI